MSLFGMSTLGSAEVDSAKMKKRIEYSGSNAIYIGTARPGTATSSDKWVIQKITYDGSNNVTQVDFANSSAEPQFIWDDRASYTYG